MLMPPELAGAPDACLDLVEDEDNAVSIGALAEALEECRRGGQVSAVTQHRFDEKRSGVIGGDA